MNQEPEDQSPQIPEGGAEPQHPPEPRRPPEPRTPDQEHRPAPAPQPVPDTSETPGAPGTADTAGTSGAPGALDPRGTTADPDHRKPAADGTPAPPDQVHYNHVNQYFYGELSAARSTFGIGGAAVPGNARRRAVGRLDAEEADALLAPYVRPPCFEEAARALAQDGVVVLVGPDGSGKRSGAVALVAEVAERTAYVVLSPGRSLEDLAGKVAFEKGVGYVLLDRMSSVETSQTADFDWRRVRDTVREHGAHLVVTTVHTGDGARVESVRHVPWQPPDLGKALRVRLARARCAADVVDRSVELMPDGCRITDVAAAAARIARGAGPEDVWPDYGSGAARPLREWFDADRSPQEWAEVTTLAFVNGADYRDFETCQERLEGWLAPAFPAPRTTEEQNEAARRAADRRLSLSRNALVTADRRKDGALTRTALVFPHPQYRQWALEELWARRSTPYWNGVRDWLTELVGGRPSLGLQLSVAQGLALLTRPAFDEVAENYLYPWAAGAAGPDGQSTATLVLQCMCLDESLAATALAVARDWTRSPDPVLRATGAAAFSGALGVRFPTDAVAVLLRLIVRRGGLPVQAAFALAGLLSVLAECGQDTDAVFRPLADQMRVQRETRTGRPKENTLETVLTVLRARDARTGRLVCAVLLERDPRQTDRIAELWAGVLDNRPRRGRALAVLHTTLRGLPAVSERPAEVAARFGRALGRALPAGEGTQLREPLRRTALRDDPAGTALVDTFLAAVASADAAATDAPSTED